MSFELLTWLTPLIVAAVAFFSIGKRLIIFALATTLIFLAFDILLHSLRQSEIVPGAPNSIVNPNVSATALGLSLIFTPRAIRERVSFAIIDFVALALVIMSDSKIALLCAVISLIYKYRRNMKTYRKNYLILTLLLALPVVSAFLSFSELERSLNLRLIIWKESLAILREHLILGIGPDAFLTQFMISGSASYSELKGSPTIVADPHNLILSGFLAFGIPVAILLFFLGFKVALTQISKIADQEMLAKTRFCSCLFVGQSMVNVNSLFLTFLFAGLIVASRQMGSLKRNGADL